MTNAVTTAENKLACLPLDDKRMQLRPDSANTYKYQEHVHTLVPPVDYLSIMSSSRFNIDEPHVRIGSQFFP